MHINKFFKKKCLFLMGPTACGKSKFVIYLRKYLPIEIISVDSALIYRDMNIGTDKPNDFYLLHHPHSLLNIKDPSESYSAAEFRKDALNEIKKIIKIGKIPCLVGGTMFYYQVLLYGLSNLPASNIKIRQLLLDKNRNKKNFLHEQLSFIDPISASRIHKNDHQRLLRALEVFYVSGKTLTDLKKNIFSKFPYGVIQFCMMPPSQIWLYEKIEERIKNMFFLGFQKEVENLFFRGDLHKNLPSIKSIGYRQMWEYLEYKTTYSEMFYKIIFATRKLVKHQLTWLKKWKNIHYLNSSLSHHILLKKILNLLNRKY